MRLQETNHIKEGEMSKDTSGPAFPTHHTDSNHGLTLRDYFAAMAMQAFIQEFGWGDSYDISMQKVPKAAYELANAMLSERAKGG